MRINPFTAFSKSNIGQRFYKTVLDPKNQKWLNTKLPLIESFVVTSMYCLNTERLKNTDRKNKNALQLQNVMSGVSGIALGGILNKGMDKFSNNVIKHLDPSKIEDLHKITGGLKVALPIIATAFSMRYVSQVLFVPLSCWLRDKVFKKKPKDS